MKVLKLSTIFVILMLTGVLDYLISALPLIAVVWVFASGLLGLTGLAQRLERDRERNLSLATVYLPR